MCIEEYLKIALTKIKNKIYSAQGKHGVFKTEINLKISHDLNFKTYKLFFPSNFHSWYFLMSERQRRRREPSEMLS